MILLSFDTETTGLDPLKDRVIEVGAMLYSTGHKRVLESNGYLVKTDVLISKEITEITGITQQAVAAFGYDSETALNTILTMAEDADAFVGQNVVQFDKRFLEAWAARHNKKIPDILWIDTRTDLPPHVESKSLKYLAADHGFLPSTSHAALADCETVIQIIEKYDIKELVARAKEPSVVLSSLQKFENNADAKKLKFFWKPELKKWLRVVKASDVDVLAKSAPFNISIEKEITPEQVWY
jgi:DNA polymerase III subunit epsilon